MNLNRLLESIKKHESFSRTVYKDSLGFDTIGYGSAIKNLELDEDLAGIIMERKVMSLILECYDRFPWLSSQPSRIQEVVLNMTYQMGVTGFSKFRKTIAFLVKKDYKSASLEMLRSRWGRTQSPNRALELSEIVKKEK